MENASKALIIAGAILLSILIIGIGMFIYNQATQTIQKANLSGQEVTAYNSEFEQYEGTRSGSDARQLCDLVRNHNKQYADDESRHVQVVEGEATDPNPAPDTAVTTAEVNAVKSNLKAGKTYNITFGYDASSGLVTQVGIEEKTTP